MIRAGAIAITAAVMLSALPASASPTYPEALAGQLELSCAPACTLCHDTMAGGSLTANQPVGIAVRRLRLASGNTEQLLQVIAQLEANGTDSDGDGTGDVAELRAGGNPNDAADAPLGCYTPPPAEEDGGCAVSRVRGPPRLSFLAVVLIVAVITGSARSGLRNSRPRDPRDLCRPRCTRRPVQTWNCNPQPNRNVGSASHRRSRKRRGLDGGQVHTGSAASR
jgi:hypothetical protein